MTAPVPLSALATCLEDIDAPLTTKFLFSNATHLHRDMEYLWGLKIYTIDPTHERSVLHMRKSMGPLSRGSSRWTLVPTEQTLVAMDALQAHNFTDPISERRSFLTEFSAVEYEYIFVPLRTDVDFFILQPGKAPRRFSAPYAEFPRVTSSANPFFVAFDALPKIRPHHVSGSETWHRVFRALTVHWFPGVIPEEFFLVPHPKSLVSVVDSDDGDDLSMVDSDDRSDPDNDPESKFGNDETIVTPTDEEGPSAVPHKDAFVHEWVERDAKRRPKDPVPSNPPSPPPRTALQRDVTRKLLQTFRAAPRWRKDSHRGKDVTARLFTAPSVTIV
ncbi:hypothetical protein K438DRAFT_1756912 [Mycena galopus ATCC 62051]|nr:hypothetical protein K438DRAFT_1756912 [Mycena galopus ATCC 62051]